LSVYATAHRVQNANVGIVGINAFAYAHGPEGVPRNAVMTPDVQLAAARLPGVLQLELVTVPPGGNRVLSYIDIAAPDEVSMAELAATLDAVFGRLSAVGSRLALPDLTQTASVAVRFGYPSRVRGMEAREFEDLRHALLLCLQLRYPATFQSVVGRDVSPIPLRIFQTVDHVGSVYELDDPTRDALASVLPHVHFLPRHAAVRHDTKEAFELLHGDIRLHMAQALTGLDHLRLQQAGGVQFIDRATGAPVWSLP
jgi:hypothetical protein